MTNIRRNYVKIKNPINKKYILKNKHNKKYQKKEHTKNLGVSVITCTNRTHFAKNIFENYLRQDHKYKELIIILNNNNLDKEKFNRIAKQYEDIKIHEIDQRTSLGYCLNFAVSKSMFNIIAKFDDDDYYSEKYISDSLKAFEFTKAQVVGKYTTFVYFRNNKILAIRNPKRENRYVYRVEGSTLLIKKNVFKKVKFKDLNLGEDVQFCKDCYKNGIKIYSHNKYNHVYVRHGVTHNHTWGISDDFYIKLCKKIDVVDDFRPYIKIPQDT